MNDVIEALKVKPDIEGRLADTLRDFARTECGVVLDFDTSLAMATRALSTPAKGDDTSAESVEGLLNAIENAGKGYSIALTRLVDGEATYTLEYRDHVSEHPSHEDAFKKVAELARTKKRVAAFTALSDSAPTPHEAVDWKPIETALDAGCDSDVMIAGDDWVTIARVIEGQWWELNNHPTDYWGDQLYPTHWRPLPEPPRIDTILSGEPK